ncbi:hypothetical protein ACA910_022423 [Epithemia clementina (nom. ined.)]
MALVVTAVVEPIRAQEEATSSSTVPPQSGEKAESEAKTATTADTSKETEGTAQEQQPPNPSSQNNNKEGETPRRPKEVIEDKFDASNRDWGSYYDPQNVFCGKYDCYKILGFDYDSFGKNPPDTKVITKRYRKLSREWHPDKSKHRDAKERFVKIARAYEVLTDVQVRKEYDSMRFNQEAYFAKYGTSVLWSYAPKSDVTLVILLIFVVANVAMWYSQQHRWQLVANRLIKAAVEDWSTAQGGTPESKDLRAQALKILYENNNHGNETAAGAVDNGEKDNGAAEGTPGKKGAPKKLKSAIKKVSGKEKKKMEEEALLPVVQALVNEIHDFGGGFHKPTWRDLLIVSMAKAPFRLTTAVVWNANYYVRRMRGVALNDEERQVLTKRAVGPVVWDTKSEDEQQEMMKRELWILSNLAEWEEEQHVKNLSSAEQKQYAKLKKKGKLD